MKAREGGKGGAGGEGGGGVKNPLYIYRLPAWLAIHPELQVISSLPHPPSSSSSSPYSQIPPVLQADSKMITELKNNTARAYNWMKHQTENDKTHTGGDNPNPSPILDSSFFSHSV